MGYLVRVAGVALLRERVEVEWDGEAAAALDDDAMDALEDQIATLSAQLNAATQRLLGLVLRFDQAGGWKRAGHRTCAHWLAHRTGIDLGAAREKVRAARALAKLPLTSEAMARGEVSFSQVRAITRVADAENEAALLALARGTDAGALERMVRAWKRGNRNDEAERERELHASRTLSVFPDEEGMYLVRGRLTPEVGAVLMRALEAAGDALFRERGWPGLLDETESEREAARRRADAIGLLAERALGVGFGGEGGCGEPERGAHGAPDTPSAPCGCAHDAPISGTRAERYQVVVHTDLATLSAGAEPGRSELDDGVRVSAETSRRLACDAGVVRVTHAAEGGGVGAPDAPVLSVGRRTRSIPPALRRALDARDRGCRFPGCGSRFTDAHHVVHWADGGETSLENCLLLCRHHHRLVHEDGWSVLWWGKGRPAFYGPNGQMTCDGRWEPPAGVRALRAQIDPGEGAESAAPHPLLTALLQDNHRAGARPDAATIGVRWKSERDVPDDVYFPARASV